MHNVNRPLFHGYVNSTLDNAVRVCLTNGRIVTLTITPLGIEAQLLGQKLRMPEELRQIGNVSQLVNFLHSHRLSLIEQEITIERQSNGVAPQAIRTSPPISFDDV
ncbi:MAG TPA: hypothetical protein VK249_01710 [Anaerolineales bacterium]|nr:hypothetical protein [Anaerolineales bacterium]